MNEALRAELKRSLSQPRTLDDADIRHRHAEPNDPGVGHHAGHRYFTPQPGRKKPQLAVKPLLPGNHLRMHRASRIQEDDEEKDDDDDDDDADDDSSSDSTTTDQGTSLASSDHRNEAMPNGHVPMAAPIPLPPGAADGSRPKPRLSILRATNKLEPLKPSRIAPSRPPAGRRRRSDTHIPEVQQAKSGRHPGASKEDMIKEFNSLKRGSKVARSASSAADGSEEREHFVRKQHPHYFTPQPSRRKFNLVERTPSMNDGSQPAGPVERLALKTKRFHSHTGAETSHSPDSSPGPHLHTHTSPVSPLATLALKPRKMTSADSGYSPDTPSSSSGSPGSSIASPPSLVKRIVSQNSSDSGLNSDMSFSSSPSPHTPVSPLAAPAFKSKSSGRQSVRPAPAVPEVHQWKASDPPAKQWTKPEKSHHGLKDVSRGRPVSTPDRIRRVSKGSVNKSKQRKSAVRQAVARQQASSVLGVPTSPTSSRQKSARSRHRSAPAGRVTFTNPAEMNVPLSNTPGVVRRRRSSDNLRKEVLRSVSMERSRKMSLKSSVDQFLMEEDGQPKEETNPLEHFRYEMIKEEPIRKKSGRDDTDFDVPAYNGVVTKPPLNRFVSEEIGSVYSDYPSTFSASPGPSPTRNRPKLRRGRSSKTSIGSLRSVIASKELLSEIFLSDRKSHRRLKGFVGFLVGILLGAFLFLGVYYGLEYSLVASICISSVGTVCMCLCLALTVRARCVAALMVPTLCTSKGRAAFLAIIVALLLTGPIDNIYINANVASTSISCSTELAHNQTILIKEAAQAVFDVYVRNLMSTVRSIQEAVENIHDVFRPIEDLLGQFADTLGEAGEQLALAAGACREIFQGAYKECTEGLNGAFRDCKRTLQGVPNLGEQQLDQVCNYVKVFDVCVLFQKSDDICMAPQLLDNAIALIVADIQAAINNLVQLFNTDVDFSVYWDSRANQSQSFQSIQDAIQDELQESISFLNRAFSVVDKIIALSVLFLLFRSYLYHSKYRTKDRFDNFYVTDMFKIIDKVRAKNGRETILPLKKSERRRLIDLSSPWLSKPEKGLFRLGMATVLLHSVIAALLILADYGLFWLLSLIARHGRVQFDISGGGGAELVIGGTGILANFLNTLFGEGVSATNVFNITLDTEQCLPKPIPPNEAVSIGVGILYLVAVLMVLFQAYALRVRRRIAAYFYPEREIERIHHLYNTTLQRRHSLFKLLKERIKQSKRQIDAEQRVSFVAYLSARYPCWRKIFRALGKEKRPCFGCADVDNGTFKTCGNPDCNGNYCMDCLREIGNTCTLCHEIIEGSKLSIGVVEHTV